MAEPPRTPDGVKAELLECIKDWMDDPGESTKLTIEIRTGLSPQTQQKIRLFDIKLEKRVIQAAMNVEEPLVQPVHLSAVPPKGNQH